MLFPVLFVFLKFQFRFGAFNQTRILSDSHIVGSSEGDGRSVMLWIISSWKIIFHCKNSTLHWNVGSRIILIQHRKHLNFLLIHKNFIRLPLPHDSAAAICVMLLMATRVNTTQDPSHAYKHNRIAILLIAGKCCKGWWRWCVWKFLNSHE